MAKRMTRRELLRCTGLVSAGGLLLAACQPAVVEVEKVVKETVVVEKEIEKVVERTVVVAAPADQPVEITWWGYAIGIRYVPGRPWGNAAPEDWDNWQRESFMSLHPNVKVNILAMSH
ncbi:MAG: hypothetical protein FJZ90_15115 [Chloroflexi bacterium]|nr:hypothetical protein [Chloroflexota bacterium]